MRARTGLWIAAALAVVFGAGWWITKQDPAAAGVAPSRVDEVASPEESDAEPAPVAAALDEGGPRAEGERRPAEVHGQDDALLVRVEDPQGVPIPGVLITCNAIRDDPTGPSAKAVPWFEPQSATLRAVSDERGLGQIALDPSDDGSRRLVLWATRAGYRAAGLLLDRREGSPSAELVLGLGSEIGVEVVDASGRAVRGALVRACADVEEARISPAEGLPWLRRELSADGEGRALLPDFGGETWVWAEFEGKRSAPWRGQAPARVRLVISETFEVSGEVTAPPELEPGDEGWTVRVLAESGPVTRWLQSIPVRAGSFGPVSIPLLEGARYGFRLVGKTVVPTTEWIDSPRPGGSVFVRLTAESSGLATGVIVRDPSGAPIEGARVQGFHWSPDGWTVSEGRTNHEGLCELRNVRRGDILLRASKEGYYQAEPSVWWKVQRPDVIEPPVIVLQPAAKVRGVVRRAGRPLQTFRVSYWLEGATERRDRTFAGCSDGAFTITEAPIGRVRLQAGSPGLPPSPIVTVETKAGEEVQVVLDIDEAWNGRGRVVDLWTGEPIGGAKVELYSTEGGYPIASWGIHATTREDGWFEIDRLTSPDTTLTVNAPGYASTRIELPEVLDGPVDLGLTRLSKTHELVVQAVAEGIEDFTGYKIQLSGPVSFPMEPLEPSGLHRFENLNEGSYTVRVTSPDWQWTDQLVPLWPGLPHEVRIRAPSSGFGDLEVLVTPPPSESIGGLATISCTISGEAQPRIQYAPVPEDGLVTLHGPFSDEFVLDVMDMQSQVRATRRCSSSDLKAGRVELRIESEPWTVRVVDPSGSPVADAAVELTLPDDALAWFSRGWTGPDGRCSFLSTPSGEAVTVSVYSFTRGVRAGLLVPPDQRNEEEFEIRLPECCRISLVIRDGEIPLAGVAPRLTAIKAAPRAIESPVTDVAGRTAVGPLAPGTYTVDAWVEHAWPARMEIEVAPGRTEFEMQVRRLGSLAVEVRAASGALVPGAAVGLTSVEFGEDVAQWIADGKVTAPQGGMVTGPDGRLLVTAIPNGPYRWRVQAPDGNWIEGEVVVPPLEVGSLVVQLP